jgi:hypothetical protein
MHANGDQSFEKIVYSKVTIMIKDFDAQGADGDDDMESLLSIKGVLANWHPSRSGNKWPWVL